MPLSDFDVPTKALLGTAFDLAWSTLPDHDTWIVNRRVDVMRRLTRQLLEAAEAGERDIALLVKAALEGVERAFDQGQPVSAPEHKREPHL